MGVIHCDKCKKQWADLFIRACPDCYPWRNFWGGVLQGLFLLAFGALFCCAWLYFWLR